MKEDVEILLSGQIRLAEALRVVLYHIIKISPDISKPQIQSIYDISELITKFIDDSEKYIKCLILQ